MGELEESRRWRSQIEPLGVAAASGDDMALRISQAISAKRQADALERIAAVAEKLDFWEGSLMTCIRT